jgi:hypothetical protein
MRDEIGAEIAAKFSPFCGESGHSLHASVARVSHRLEAFVSFLLFDFPFIC